MLSESCLSYFVSVVEPVGMWEEKFRERYGTYSVIRFYQFFVTAIGSAYIVGFVILSSADAAGMQGFGKVLAQKKLEALQIADAQDRRKQIVERKKKERDHRKKLLASSDLFKGDPRDLVFFVNLSSVNVTLGLSDDPAFSKSPISTCYVAPTKIDVIGDEFTAEAFGESPLDF